MRVEPQARRYNKAAPENWSGFFICPRLAKGRFICRRSVTKSPSNIKWSPRKLNSTPPKPANSRPLPGRWQAALTIQSGLFDFGDGSPFRPPDGDRFEHPMQLSLAEIHIGCDARVQQTASPDDIGLISRHGFSRNPDSEYESPHSVGGTLFAYMRTLK